MQRVSLAGYCVSGGPRGKLGGPLSVEGQKEESRDREGDREATRTCRMKVNVREDRRKISQSLSLSCFCFSSISERKVDDIRCSIFDIQYPMSC